MTAAVHCHDTAMTCRPATTALTSPAQRRRTSILLMLLVLVAAAVFWVGLGAAPVAAHTELRSSNPAEGQRLDVAPETVELVFDQPIVDNFATVVARPGPGGEPTELAVGVDGARVSATVPPDLTNGTPTRNSTAWTIAYRVVSEDGHPITGQLRFTVAAGPETTASPTPSPAPPVIPGSGGSAPAAPGRDGATDAGGQALATVVIGLFTAGATVGVMYLLARGRSRGDQP